VPAFTPTQLNSSGLIGVIDDPNGSGYNHALLGCQISLVNLNDPTLRNGSRATNANFGTNMPITFMTNTSDTNLACVAWIAGNDPANSNAPRMPKLVASLTAPNGLAVEWKLNVTFHDRNGNPHRDFDTGDPNNSLNTEVTPQDVVTIPSDSSNPNYDDGWRKLSPTNSGTWDIWADKDWTNQVAKGFFGGDATISLRILNGNGEVLSGTNSYNFRIAGENSQPTDTQNYITSKYGGPTPPTRKSKTDNSWDNFWFAYAVAKEETTSEGGQPYYNQFLYNGGQYKAIKGREGHVNWNNDGNTTGTGGYGPFQLTYQPGQILNGVDVYHMPRGYIWNWQTNAVAVGAEFNEKLTFANTLRNELTNTYGKTCGDLPQYKNFSGLEAIVVTAYNSFALPSSTCPNSKLTTIKINGIKNPVTTC
jgi:hypothetical protein